MKLSEKMEAILQETHPNKTLDDLTNSELIDLIASDFKPWVDFANFRGTAFPDQDVEDIFHGVTPSERR